MSPSLEYAALRFLNHWIESEEELHQSLQDPDAESIRKALAYFKVSRGFREISKPHRANRVARALKAHDKYVTPNTAIQRVQALAEELSRPFGGKYLVSAASKLLWLRRRSPYIIYDSRAVKALRKLGHPLSERDYYQYSLAWRVRFEERRGAIHTAVRRLPDIKLFTVAAGLDNRSVKTLVVSPWFAERVFDQYLWLSGASNE